MFKWPAAAAAAEPIREFLVVVLAGRGDIPLFISTFLRVSNSLFMLVVVAVAERPIGMGLLAAAAVVLISQVMWQVAAAVVVVR